MKKELITYETAKLAKEKGFDIFSEYGGYIFDLDDLKLMYIYSELSVRDYINKELAILAPTQSLLQRWLRENHNINMLLEPYPDHYWCYVFKWAKGREHDLNGHEGIGDSTYDIGDWCNYQKEDFTILPESQSIILSNG